MLLPDIYFEKDYAVLTSIIEGGEAQEYIYSDDNGTIRNVFIKRSIDLEIEGKKYYDIITPYGYGGPIILDCLGNKEELTKNYKENFREFCKSESIVSELIRFHPILNNALDFKSSHNIELVRKTVATRLEENEDAFTKEFSKSTRKLIRRLLSDEKFTYKIYNNPANLENFIKIYKDTMDRNQARDFCYFGKDYFDKLSELFSEETYVIDVFYDSECIASGLYFIYGDFLHAHLSGTLNKYLDLSPAYYLKYLTLELGQAKGCKYIHYGGGTSNAEDDGLLAFKKKFTKTGIFDFYIAKEIHLEDIYKELVEKSQKRDPGFFPEYRARTR